MPTFAIDDPPLKRVLNSPGNGPGDTINHLGVEMDSPANAPGRQSRCQAQRHIL